MADFQSFTDRVYYTNRREYTQRKGSIAYLDGTPLRRPFTMPRAQRLIALAIVAVAIVLGAVFINNTVLTNMRALAQTEQTIADNLARPASIETTPIMSQVITMNNDEIKALFQSAGYNMFDASDPDNPENMVLYKLPDDVSAEEAAGFYAKGVGSLSAVQATKLLNGSWYFAADRNGITSMVVRYADFSTAKPVEAVKNAIAKQGIDPNSATEAGEDDSGNTYSSGTLDANGVTCAWKVSALPLGDMYSIRSMPEDACYVGVRLTVM